MHIIPPLPSPALLTPPLPQDVEKLDRFIHPPSGDTSSAQQQQPQRGASGLGGAGNVGGDPVGAGMGFRPGGEGSGGGAAGANFDVVTAIRVLKSAGHADHAAELARRHGGEIGCFVVCSAILPKRGPLFQILGAG